MPVRVVSGRTALADSAAQLKKAGGFLYGGDGQALGKSQRRPGRPDRSASPGKNFLHCIRRDYGKPLLSSCEEAAALAAEKKAAFVVGIGGGSPLDAVKAIAALAANPGLDREGFSKSLEKPAAAHCADRYHLRHRQRGQPYSVLTVDGVKKVCFGPGFTRLLPSLTRRIPVQCLIIPRFPPGSTLSVMPWRAIFPRLAMILPGIWRKRLCPWYTEA